MTSQKSSADTFIHSFLQSVKSVAFIPIIIMCVLFAFVAGVISEGQSQTNEILAGIREGVHNYKYYILGDSFAYGGDFTTIAFHTVFAIAAILMAVLIFRFMNSKKSVNVYFSLGVTRANLFISKYLAGAALIVLMITIPFIANYAANVYYFGNSVELSQTMLYLILGLITYTLNIFTVTSLVLCFVGTFAEGIIYSVSFLAAPSLFASGVEMLMDKFVHGSSFYPSDGSPFSNALISCNPFRFFYGYMCKYGTSLRSMLTAEQEQIGYMYNDKWTAPDFGPIVGWLIAIAVLFVASLFVFKARKTEKGGFWGASKLMIVLLTLEATLFAFCFGVDNSSKKYAFIVGLVAAIIVCLAVGIILIFNFKLWVKKLKFAPIYIAAAAVLGVVFVTGLFGYETRVPAMNDIESVDILPIIDNSLYNPSQHSINAYSGDMYSSTDYSYDPTNTYESFTVTDGEDISLAAELHKRLIDDGALSFDADNSLLPREEQNIEMGTEITYHLKNGKVMTRSYSMMTVKTAVEFVKLSDSEAFRKRVNEIFTQPMSSSDSPTLINDKLFIQSEDNIIYLASKYMNDNYTILDMTKEQRMELLAAVSADISTVSMQKILKPEAEQLGVLIFTDDKMSILKEYTADSSGWTFSGYDLSKGEEYISASPFFPIENRDRDARVRDFSSYEQCPLPIYEYMTNTVKFLSENGFLAMIEKETEIESVAFIKSSESFKKALNDSSKYSWSSSYSNMMQYSGSYRGTSPQEYDIVPVDEVATVTDAATIEAVAKNSYITCIADKDIYFVRINFKGGGISYMYAPVDALDAALAK